MQRLRILAIAGAAFVLALLAISGSALQFSALMSEALAQSSDPVREDSTRRVTEAPSVVLPGGSVRPPADAVVPIPTEPGVTREGEFTLTEPVAGDSGPLGTRGSSSTPDVWGYLRHGGTGSASTLDDRGAMLMQDSGMGWLEWRAKYGPLQKWGGYAMLGMLVLLLVFYLIRGRIRIEHGFSGAVMERFKSYERFAHWVLAGSFVLLAISGLNLLYGKDYLLPLIGKEAFATISLAGKWVHNNVSWAFMAALLMVFIIWVGHNLPARADLEWLLKGGGMFRRGTNPPAPKFNAGQKLLFWAVILCGASISLSGIALLFPYQAPMFGATFEILNSTGLAQLFTGGPLPTELNAVQEMQYAQIWHSIVGLALITIIFAHIYIGTVGMEGAFSAMGSGYVDRNWALEHHAIWVAEEDSRLPEQSRSRVVTPAE
ncbi:MAG TPA: formate dehydrogenase subunit gamma [Paracoccaceae bacterium]|nr:formate dehydrogenase subunit gamma [Paracoccaceae bacterium]